MKSLKTWEAHNGHYITSSKYSDVDGVGVFLFLMKRRKYWFDKKVETRYIHFGMTIPEYGTKENDKLVNAVQFHILDLESLSRE